MLEQPCDILPRAAIITLVFCGRAMRNLEMHINDDNPFRANRIYRVVNQRRLCRYLTSARIIVDKRQVDTL